MTHSFDIGNHSEQAHGYVSTLIDEAYKRKADNEPTTASERVLKAESLTEAYYAQVGVMPAESVLSRLAWYIVFDEMTDSHPDKITREEYPILSDWQQVVRNEKHINVKDIEFGDRRGKGRRKSHFTSKDGFVGVNNGKLADKESPEIETIDVKIDLMELLNSANLTLRQRETIDLVYFENLTQEVAGEVMGVEKHTINEHLTKALRKLRKRAELLID